jgi:Outer membrane protein beta-barrel domain
MERNGNCRVLSVWLFSSRCAAAIFGWYLALAPAIYGQGSSSVPVPDNSPSGWRRFSFGGRVNGYPFNLLNNKDVSLSPASTTQSWAITTSNNYLKIALGPSLEFRLTRKFTLCGEFLYHRVDYTKTATVTDGSNTTTIAEQTRATFWDAPVMLRYGNLSESGFRSKLYFAGGGAVRNVSNIQTTNQTTYPDSTTATNNTPAVASARNLPGAVLGVGLRLVDDFNIKLSPELRFTRWIGATFASDSTRTRRDELVVGIALTF